MYLTGYLDKAIRPLDLIMLKMREYIQTFNVKNADKDKGNKLISFRIDDEKLLKNMKLFGIRVET